MFFILFFVLFEEITLKIDNYIFQLNYAKCEKNVGLQIFFLKEVYTFFNKMYIFQLRPWINRIA